MEDSGLRPDRITFCAMLNACAKLQSLAKAEAPTKRALRLEVRSSFMIMRSLRKTVLRKRARQEWFEKMLSYHIPADLIAYNSFVAACASQGKSQRAEELLASMHSERIAPDSVTYNGLLYSYARSAVLEDITLSDSVRADVVCSEFITRWHVSLPHRASTASKVLLMKGRYPS